MSDSKENENNSSKTQFAENPDITFVFPDDNNSKIFAKKSKLSEWSEVLKKQFESGLDPDQIVIKDASFDSFCTMMKHINGEQIVVNEENFQQMIYLSRKYFMNSLASTAINAAKIVLKTPEDALKYYSDIKMFNIIILNEHIKDIFVRKATESIDILNIRSEIHLEILKMILSSEYLSCSEFELYQHTMSMIKKTMGDLTWEEIKKKLGKSIYHIGFPNMTINELIACGKEPSLLKPEQISDLLLWMNEKSFSETLQLFPTLLKPRIYMISKSCSNEKKALIKCECGYSCYNIYLNNVVPFMKK